jgi:hypothetical protein
MFNIMRIYLDQMFNIRVANALRAEGYDVLRASEMGQARADDVLRAKSSGIHQNPMGSQEGCLIHQRQRRSLVLRRRPLLRKG